MRRQLLALGVALSAAACQGSVSSAWTGEAAIGLSTSYGSPVGFECVIGWDLHYQPSGTVSNLTVDARVPTAVQDQLVTTTPAGLPMTEPWPRFDEWGHSAPQAIGASSSRGWLAASISSVRSACPVIRTTRCPPCPAASSGSGGPLTARSTSRSSPFRRSANGWPRSPSRMENSAWSGVRHNSACSTGRDRFWVATSSSARRAKQAG
jgi:hypothetical protein